MRFTTHKSLLCKSLRRLAAAAAIFAAACALAPGAARAEDKPPIVMKISLAALNEALTRSVRRWARVNATSFSAGADARTVAAVAST